MHIDTNYEYSVVGVESALLTPYRLIADPDETTGKKMRR